MRLIFSLSIFLWALIPATASALTLPPAVDVQAPFVATWDVGDGGYGPPMNFPPRCDGYAFRTIKFYDTFTGHSFYPPWQATTLGDPQTFNFSCANNIGTDECSYPLSFNYVYEICNNSESFVGEETNIYVNQGYLLTAPAAVIALASSTAVIVNLGSGVWRQVDSVFPALIMVWAILLLIFALMGRVMNIWKR